MSKDSNNLEDFFRNSLKDFSANPSDDLWNRIEDNIPTKPSRKVRPAYVLFALLFLMALGFGYEYFHFKSQILTVSETANLQKEELNNLKTELDVVKNQLRSTLQSLDNEAKRNEKFNNSEMTFNELDNSDIDKISYPKLANTKSEISILENEKIENTVEKVAVKNQKNVDSADSGTADATFETALSAPTIFLNSKLNKAKSFDDTKLPLLSLPKKKRISTSVELYASVLKTFLNNSNKIDDQAKVKNWEPSTDFGALFGLGLNNKWDVQVGVGYSKMVVNDAIATELSYAREEYDQSSGTYTTFYSFPVNTPSGEVVVNTLLSNQKENDGRDIIEGDPFTLDLQYQDEIEYFQVPVFVRYKMGSGKFRVSLKGGFIQKFLLNEKVKLNAVNTKLDRLENGMTQLLEDKTSAATTSIDVSFGAGAEFRLSPTNSVHLQSVFSYSLKEIYPGVKPYSIGLQLGLQHQLGR